MKKIFNLAIFAILAILAVNCVAAASNELSLKIASPKNLSGSAGDYVTIQADMQNNGTQPVNNIILYLSLVNLENNDFYNVIFIFDSVTFHSSSVPWRTAEL